MPTAITEYMLRAAYAIQTARRNHAEGLKVQTAPRSPQSDYSDHDHSVTSQSPSALPWPQHPRHALPSRTPGAMLGPISQAIGAIQAPKSPGVAVFALSNQSPPLMFQSGFMSIGATQSLLDFGIAVAELSTETVHPAPNPQIIVRACENLALAVAKGINSTHSLITATGAAAVPALSTMGPGISTLTGILSFISGIETVLKDYGRAVTSMLVLHMLTVLQPDWDAGENPLWYKSESSWKGKIVRTNPNIAPYFWFSFKYNRGFLGHLRTTVESIGVPMIALATGIMSLIMLGATIASAGTITLALATIVGAAGTTSFVYRGGKYFQSVDAFKQYLRADSAAMQDYHNNQEALTHCLHSSHALMGHFMSETQGATLGDWFRYKLACQLLAMWDLGQLEYEAPQFAKTTRASHQLYTRTLQTEQEQLRAGLQLTQELLIRGIWETIKADKLNTIWQTALHDLTILDQNPPIHSKHRIKIFFDLIRKNR